MSKIALVIARPNCYDDKTEILTSIGWKLFKDISYDDKVAQIDKELNIEFVQPMDIISQSYSGDMISFKDGKGRLDLLVTPNHRMVYHKDGEDLEIGVANDIKYYHSKHIPRTGWKYGKIVHLTALEKLSIAFQADGSYVGKQYTYNRKHRISFEFTKKRKYNNLIDILKEGNFKYKEYKFKNRPKNYNIVVWTHIKLDKIFNYIDLEHKGSDWCREFLWELTKWDSTIRQSNNGKFRFVYTSKIKQNIDTVMTIASLCFTGCNYSLYKSKKIKHSDVHALSLIFNSFNVNGQCIKKESILYNGKIYCVTVPTGMLVVRRNNCISISGNSSRLPDKHNRLIGNLTMMDWILRRLQEVVDDVVICTTKKGLKYYSKYVNGRVKIIAPETDDNNVLGRIRKAAAIYKGNYYLIVSGDCPLISVPIMKDLLKQLMINRGFDACMIDDGTSHLGADAISWKGIQKLEQGEHLSLKLVPNLNLFRLITLPNIYAKFRATVDNHADLAFMRECYQLLGSEYTFEGVSDLITTTPSLNGINAHVSQKNINFTTDKPNVALIAKGDIRVGVGHIARIIAIGQYFNECCHKHIHFFVNNHKLVKKIMKKYGYEYGLDYSYGQPTILEEEFNNWEFIHDFIDETTYDYDAMYRKDARFGVDMRLGYVSTPIYSDIVVSFGKGTHLKFGVKIFKSLPTCKKNLLYGVDNLASYLIGAKRIITMWSQTAREAIFLGKVPEVYTANDKDDKLCKYLDKKGVLKWKGNLHKTTKI